MESRNEQEQEQETPIESGAVPSGEEPQEHEHLERELVWVAVAELVADEENREVDKESPDFNALVESVTELGILEPLVVRPSSGEGQYMIIAGHRRYAAALEACMSEVPVVIFDNVSEQTASAIRVSENLHRRALRPLEEARQVESMLAKGHTTASAAKMLGMPHGWVVRRSRLSHLTPKLVKTIDGGKTALSRWSAEHLEQIALLDPAAQDEFYDTYSDSWLFNGIPKMDELKRVVAEHTQTLGSAPWNVNDSELVPKAGACLACPKTSGCVPGLFDDEPGAGTTKKSKCLDPVCWEQKLAAHTVIKVEELKQKHGKRLVLVVEGGATQNDIDKLKKRHGTEIESLYSFRAAKKTDDGAIPCVIVAGQGTGTVRWVVDPKTANKRRRAATKGANGEATAERPAADVLAERKDALSRRRASWRINYVSEVLQEHISKGQLVDGGAALRLAVVFGTNQNARYPAGDAESKRQWKQMESMTDTKAATALWEAVAPVLITRLTARGHELPDYDARRIAELMSLDWEKIVEQSIAEIPEPKSFEALTKRAREEKRGDKTTAKAKKTGTDKDESPAEDESAA